MILSEQTKIDEFTDNGWWGDKTIADLLDDAVSEKPEAEALIDPLNRPDVDGFEPRRLSWTQVDEAVNRWTHVLASHGIGKDDVFSVQLPNTVELGIAYLAAARLGAIISPFPVQFREHELEQMVPFVGATLHITVPRVGEREYASVVAGIKAQLDGLETVLVLGDEAPEGTVAMGPLLEDADASQPAGDAEPTANDILTVCWTSGTEGSPKGVPRSHNHWFISAYATVDSAELTGDDVLLNPFPMVNMAGVGGMLVPWLLTGSKLVMHQPFDLMVFLRQIARERINYTVVPPALLNMLLKKKEMIGKADLSSVRIFGSGSAPLSPWMVETWQEEYDIYVINLFGSNEGCTLVSAPSDFPSPTKRAKFFPRFGVEGFEWDNRVADCMKSKLVDLETEEEITEPGQPGELRLWGAAIFPGYWKADELTEEAFDEDGYFKTGDVFTIAGDGENERYYEFIDRAKDVIIRGGANISASEVEGLLTGMDGLAEIAVVAMPDEALGEKACAFVVPEDGSTIALDDIIEFMRDKKVASYKIPEAIRTIDQLPRNPVGKVDKPALRDRV